VRYAVHDRSREFITFMACVSALGKTLLLTIIFKGDSRDIQESWVTDVEKEEVAFFACSENRWSSDAYGLEWLQKVFHPQTQHQRRRLLIVDGYSSHVNMAFLD
jgi:hypothetical protein